MEDAATAEISRTQVWQWLRHGASLDDGRPVTASLVRDAMQQETAALRALITDPESLRRFDDAAGIFETITTSDTLEEFLTLPAYDQLCRYERKEER